MFENAKKPVGIADFAKFHFLSSPAFSPDGQKVAFLRKQASMEGNNYPCDLMLIDSLETPVPRSLASDVSGFLWRDEETIYAFIRGKNALGESETTVRILRVNDAAEQGRFTLRGNANPVCLDRDGAILYTALRDLDLDRRLAKAEDKAAMLSEIEKERDHFIIVDEYPFWINGEGVINKLRVSLNRCEADGKNDRQLTSETFHVEDVAYDPATNRALLAGENYDIIRPYRPGLFLLDCSTGELRCLVKPTEFKIEHIGFFRGQGIFAGTRGEHHGVVQCRELFELDLVTGQTRSILSKELSVRNPVCSDCRNGGGREWLARDNEVYFLSGILDHSHLLRFDGEELSSVIARDGSIDAFAWNNGRVAFVALYDMRPQELYFRDTDGSIRQLTHFHDDYCKQHAIVFPKRLFFRDSNGDEVHGFILEPVDYDPSKSYPMILDIHGGPRLSYGEVFYHEMQYFTSRGYFVVFANPHGSDGFGEEFGYLCGKFGTIDYDNLMQFVDLVLERYPQIDSKRMGVMGGSYGGFMTNWIITHTDRFQAAVSQRSISNWISLEGTSDFGPTLSEGQQNAGTFRDLEKTWWHSPLKYAQNAVTPTLFIQSMEDFRCPVSEAMQMYTALKLHGATARMCLFYHENHDLSRTGRPKSRIKRLQEISDWMDRYLMPEESKA